MHLALKLWPAVVVAVAAAAAAYQRQNGLLNSYIEGNMLTLLKSNNLSIIWPGQFRISISFSLFLCLSLCMPDGCAV